MRGTAEHQAKIRFSYKKYYSFRNKIHTKFSEKFHSDMQIEAVSQALFYGDTQPALVISTDPLMIAAYSDEMDGIVMLRFPAQFVETYGLEAGTRLTSSCIYYEGKTVAPDIFPGSGWSRQYAEFVPIIQLFIGKKDDKIREKVALFSEEVWESVRAKADEYLTIHPGIARDGFFYFKK